MTKVCKLEWMNKLRERLKETSTETKFNVKLKWKEVDSVIKFIKPILEYGEKTEKALAEHYEKKQSGECGCDSCEYDRRMEK